MKKVGLLVAAMVCISGIGLSWGSAFLPPGVFHEALSFAVETSRTREADALVATYADMAKFLLKNKDELQLSSAMVRQLRSGLKTSPPALTDRGVEKALAGKWQSVDGSVVVDFKADGRGEVTYRRRNKVYPFHWSVADATIHYRGDSSLDKIIYIDQGSYVYRSSGTGKIEFMQKVK